MASIHPQHGLDALRGALERKGLPAAVLLHGPEEHFRSEGLKLLLGALGDLDVAQLDGSSPPEALAALPLDLQTAALFGGGKLIVLRESLALSGKGRDARLEEALLRFLAQPVPGIHLAVMRREKLEQRAPLLKAVQAARGTVLLCRELYATPFPGRKAWESELHAWILDQARRRGLALPAEGALFLSAVLGRAPGELAGFLDRLRLFLDRQPGRTIDRNLLQRLLGPGGESNQFELAEALLLGDLRLSLLRARAILCSGFEGQDGQRLDPERALAATFAWVHQAAARCFKAHFHLAQGLPHQEVESRLKVHPFFRDGFWKEVRATRPAGLERLLRALLAAQERQRVGGEQPGRVLDLFVLEALH